MVVSNVREAVKEFLAAMRKKQRATRTVDGYAQRLLVFCDWIDQENERRRKAQQEIICLSTITVRVVDAFIAHLRETHKSHRKRKTEISTYTLAGYTQYIKGFLSWCEQDEEYGEQIRSVVIKRIKRPEREAFLIKPFQPEHIQAFLDLCRADRAEQEKYTQAKEMAFRNELILRLLLATGMRATECCSLTLNHVYLEPEECYVRVHGKRNRWREIPLIAFPMEARKKKMERGRNSFKPMPFTNEQGNQVQNVRLDDELRRHLKQYRTKYRTGAGPDDPFFVSRYGDGWLTVNTLGHIITKLAKRAEITLEQTSPHVFRHTWASLFMKHVGNIYLLSKLMGHSSVKTTEEYLKSLQGEEVRVAFLRQIGEL